MEPGSDRFGSGFGFSENRPVQVRPRGRQVQVQVREAMDPVRVLTSKLPSRKASIKLKRAIIRF